MIENREKIFNIYIYIIIVDHMPQIKCISYHSKHFFWEGNKVKLIKKKKIEEVNKAITIWDIYMECAVPRSHC